MESNPLEEMHIDHRLWRREQDQWHDDVRAWELELAELLAEFDRAKGVLRSQADRVATHAAAIKLYGQEFAKHEHQLARSCGGPQSESAASQLNHIEEREKQSELRTSHERMKWQHHSLVVHCRVWLNALSSGTWQ